MPPPGVVCTDQELPEPPSWHECCRMVRHGITQPNYYYQFRCVRYAYLENIPGDPQPPQIVPVEPGILQMYE